MTYPLFVTLLSRIVLRHNVNFYKWLIVTLGYIGVLFLTRPSTFSLDYNSILAAISGLLDSVLTAIIIITIKVLTRDDNPIVVLSFTNLGITILSLLFSIKYWDITISKQDVTLLFFVGVLDFIVKICLVKALKYSSPVFVTPFEYVRIPFSILIGWIMFGEIPVFMQNTKN
jgi:drug/metabolite transporter (DMT)-like permease